MYQLSKNNHLTLTLHLLAQIRAPAIPHVLHSHHVLLLHLVQQQQRDARHHQLVHDAQTIVHLRLLAALEHGCRVLVQFLRKQIIHAHKNAH